MQRARCRGRAFAADGRHPARLRRRQTAAGDSHRIAGASSCAATASASARPGTSRPSARSRSSSAAPRFEKNIGFLLEMIGPGAPAAAEPDAGDRRRGARHCRRCAARPRPCASRTMSAFVGYLPRDGGLRDCYAAADVFTFASHTETQGLVLLEAMAIGLPVLAIPALGAAEIIAPAARRHAAADYAGGIRRATGRTARPPRPPLPRWPMRSHRLRPRVGCRDPGRPARRTVSRSGKCARRAVDCTRPCRQPMNANPSWKKAPSRARPVCAASGTPSTIRCPACTRPTVNEDAFRQESLLAALMIPVALSLPVGHRQGPDDRQRAHGADRRTAQLGRRGRHRPHFAGPAQAVQARQGHRQRRGADRPDQRAGHLGPGPAPAPGGKHLHGQAVAALPPRGEAVYRFLAGR
jgi:hypothetical protein